MYTMSTGSFGGGLGVSTLLSNSNLARLSLLHVCVITPSFSHTHTHSQILVGDFLWSLFIVCPNEGVVCVGRTLIHL